ncbi:hypothetical protein RJ640_005298 [Escallonia rubra]|uniref:Uncharacterized protein n=1 Tax=Escallonia rubra TaxID=112253 RepID=A0AA88QLR3_9ASTE|nr:hypothetical protein RJ640_005298 [Escallonia rubra]
MEMIPYHQTYSSEEDYQTHHLHQASTSLYSQQSLPSVPSPTSQPHHLLTSHHHCIATLKGHNSYVSSLALRGKFMYTGSSDKEIRCWKRTNLSSDHDHESVTDSSVIAGKGAVKSLLVSTDTIFSAHQDHKIRVWKIDDHETHNQKFTHTATLPTLSDRASKLLIPKNHVEIRRHKTSTWVHHVDTVSALALSSDESFLYSVSWDRTLKIWRTTDFKCLESVRLAHDDAINAVALSDDGHVYTGSADKKIKVWRKSHGEKKHSLVATLENHDSGVNALALSTDGSVLYSGACDRSILVWEKDEGGNMELAGALRGHAKSILCLAVVSDLVCSGSADKTVRIWRGIQKSYSCLTVLEGHEGPIKCLAVASDRCSPSDASSSYLLYTATNKPPTRTKGRQYSADYKKRKEPKVTKK